MTPQQIVDAIYAKAAAEGVGPPPHPSYRDTFKNGNPDTVVTGIATTGMSTFDMLKRAVAEGRNFIISHEDTWYSDNDSVEALSGDPVYLAKKAFIDEHGLVIWRNHDLAHRMRPDPLFAGQLSLLGWEADKPANGAAPRWPVVTLPQPMTLEALAAYVTRRTGTHAHRITGPRDMMVRKVAIGVGYAFPDFTLDDDVDVIVGGEAAEGADSHLPTYDATAFAQDSTLLGRPRGIILLGHMGTEDIGMKLLAEWLAGFIKDVSIRYIPANEPFTPLNARPG
ncbi:Nif3-like dinuclear metal center hexameric protein [Novosphingobium sp.]|uniref:Nif3-like dinuclear metal center hexameric protein n=1 Tax=Novosphingobium sp. TaxID=1874826 RepID=UPI0031CFC488